MVKACAIRGNVVKRVKWGHSLIKFTVSKVKSRLFRNPAELFVIAMIVGFIVFFSYYSWLRYLTSRNAFDFVSYSQSLWGLTHGMSGAELKLPLASPILYILAVPYYFYPHAWTLFVLQPAVLAAGALPLFWIAKDELKSEKAATILAAAYLIYPALGNQNYAQWHAQSFAPLLLLLAFYFYKKRRWKPYVISIVLVLSLKIFVPVVLLFFVVYQLLSVFFIWIKKKGIVQVKLLVWPLTTFVAIVGYALIVYWVMSFTSDFYGLATISLGSDIPSGEYPSIFEAVRYYLSNPSVLISAIQADWSTKFQFLTQLFGPMGYLSLFDPPTLFLSLPWIGAGFLTSSYGAYYYSIYNQNACFVFPFIFISAVYGIKRFNKLAEYTLRKIFHFLATTVYGIKRPKKLALRKVNITSGIVLLVLICTLSFALTDSVISPRNIHQTNPEAPGGWQQVTQHDLTIMKIISFVPPDASIYADDTLASNEHIAQRRSVDVRGGRTSAFPEYVLLDFDNPFRLNPKDTQFPKLTGNPTLEELLAKYYGIFASEDGVELWKYRYSGNPVYYVPLNRIYGPDEVILSNGELSSMNGTFFQQVLSTPTTVNSPQWFWGPSKLTLGHRKNYAALPAGNYEITFRLRLLNATPISGQADDPILLLSLVKNYNRTLIENPDKSSKSVYSKDFVLSKWQNFTMEFMLSSPTWGFGFHLDNANAALECQYVILTQTSPIPKFVPAGIGLEATPYAPMAFVSANITKDIIPNQPIFHDTTIGGESSLLPFQFPDGKISMPFSNIVFSEDLININMSSNTWVDSHLNASFQLLSKNDVPYLSLTMYNTTAVSFKSPYAAALYNTMDIRLSTNSSILFGFNSPWAEGIFSSYFPTLVLHVVDTENVTHSIYIQYGFNPHHPLGEDIYYYVHPTDKLDNSLGFGQLRLVDIISSVDKSWIPYRLTRMDYRGSMLTPQTELASSYSASFNFYAAAIIESPVTVDTVSSNDRIMQSVLLDGVICNLGVNGETDVDMKLSVSGLEASLIRNVRIPLYYPVAAEVETISEVEQEYSWNLSIPEWPNYSAKIMFTLNGIRPTDITNLTLNNVSIKEAIEGWDLIKPGNLTNTITQSSPFYLQANVYLQIGPPETYYIGTPMITSIPFQDMNVILAISILPVLVIAVWYFLCNGKIIKVTFNNNQVKNWWKRRSE